METRPPASSLEPFTFPGGYEDQRGTEPVVWSVRPTTRRSPPRQAGFQIDLQVRGVEFWGYDFDGLEPVDRGAAEAAGFTNLQDNGDLTECVLTGDLPCWVERDSDRELSVIRFQLDLRADEERSRATPGNLQLGLTVGGTSKGVTDDWFEDGLQKLEQQFGGTASLVCCVTCLYSDYSPYGHGLTGMLCHRGAKSQYLEVRTKADYWSVPVTEDVLETHICPEWTRRVPGTGYRG